MRTLAAGAALLLLVPAVVFAAGKDGKGYEEGIRELSDNIVTEVAKEKHPSVAVIDFTDLKGHVTALGRFVADELSSALVLSGEVQVVDRMQFHQILDKHSIAHTAVTEPGNLKKLGAAANVHGVVIGTVSDMGAAVRVNAKVLSTETGRAITTARTSLSKTGPVAEFLKPDPKPPAPKVVEKREPGPALPSVARALYRITVTAANKTPTSMTLDLLVENTSPRDLRVSCKLLETILKDEEGAEWRQDAEHNREGLCIRGVKLPATAKQHASVTFLPRSDVNGKVFTLHFHETEPERDVLYTISGIKTEAAPAPSAP